MALVDVKVNSGADQPYEHGYYMCNSCGSKIPEAGIKLDNRGGFTKQSYKYCPFCAIPLRPKREQFITVSKVSTNE